MGCANKSSVRFVQDGRKKAVRPQCQSNSETCLELLHRWGSMTPLRQFHGVPADVIRKAEGKQFVSHPSPCLPRLCLDFRIISLGTAILIL